METLVPLQYYSLTYFNIVLVIILILFFYSQGTQLESKNTKIFLGGFGFVIAVFVLFYMGLRPISGVFIDMTMYAHTFEMFQNGDTNVTDLPGSDRGFYLFVQFCASVMTAKMFFFWCAAIYVVPLFIASVKWFKKYWFYAFVMLIASFSFWGYGVNGIRNGMATSIFILALSFYERRIIMILLVLLSVSIHKGMALPTLGLALTFVNNNTKNYIKLWLAAIPVSLILGNMFISLFTVLGFDDDRVGVYLSETVVEDAGGFRWDFIIYSGVGVLSAWYYIIKKQYQDQFYMRLVNVYIFANAFWILIIRASFSNRFAYLSWFLLGIIVIYPLLKVRLLPKQHQKIGVILVVYFMFTYFLNVILSP